MIKHDLANTGREPAFLGYDYNEPLVIVPCNQRGWEWEGDVPLPCEAWKLIYGFINATNLTT